MSTKPSYKRFQTGNAVVIVMITEYKGQKYYKRKYEARYTDRKTEERKSTDWHDDTWDMERDERSARAKATRWIRKQRALDGKPQQASRGHTDGKDIVW